MKTRENTYFSIALAIDLVSVAIPYFGILSIAFDAIFYERLGFRRIFQLGIISLSIFYVQMLYSGYGQILFAWTGKPHLNFLGVALFMLGSITSTLIVCCMIWLGNLLFRMFFRKLHQHISTI